MQTSLARRERRRRRASGRHPGSGVASKIAIALPVFLLATLVLVSLVSFVGAMDAYAYYSAGLQDPKELLEQIDLSQQTVLYDRTGQTELARFGSEKREILTYDQIPPCVLDAVTSAEDKTFWTNPGFDPSAAVSALMDAVAGRPRGASTITQQLVRDKLLPPTSSVEERKLKEILQSMKLTEEYPGREGKQEIITIYLNDFYLGNQSYGVASAASGYYGVSDLRQLSLAQCASLAAIFQQPSNYDLMVNADEQDDGTLVVPMDTPVIQRRNWILEQIRKNQEAGLLVGHYSDEQITAAEKEPTILHPPAGRQNIAPHFDLQVKRQLAALVCGKDVAVDDCQEVETGGYKVTTTIDLRMQAAAEKWLKAYIVAPNLGSRQAMNDYLKTIGVTDSFNKSHISRIYGVGQHNGAIIGIDYRTGQVLAYAGSAGFYEKPIKNPKTGKNFLDPQYDVLMGYRQPGSAFKPVNYSIAFEDHTLTAASLLMDVGTDFGGGYTPADADHLERGPLRVRQALMYSLNIPAVKAAQINGVAHLMDRANDFGITFPATAKPGVSIGIGTVEVRPADLASAYGAIANGGVLMDRTMILSVTDSKGNQIYPTQTDKPVSKRAMSAAAAFVMTNILKDNTDPSQNIWWGKNYLTGKSGSKTVRRPATLKTGTTDQTQDLMAGGWVAPPSDPNQPAIVGMVWAGNSDHSVPRSGVMSLDLAAPMWRSFMQDANADIGVADFKAPGGVTWQNVDYFSGMLPGPYTTKTVKEAFVSGTVPTQVDNTKVSMDVEETTGQLWSDTCQGVKATKGFLDLSKVDAGNATWQKYDAIWIDRARSGTGKRGGPNGGPTAYFFGQKSWGAPFPPSQYCTGPVPTPSPSGPPLPTPPRPTPTPQPTAPLPTPAHTPKHRVVKRRAGSPAVNRG